MASEPPFAGMTTPFGAHHSPFAQGAGPDVGSDTASYFGNEQESPTSNPFSFATSLGPPAQHNAVNPLTANPPDQYPTAAVVGGSNSSGTLPGEMSGGQWFTHETQNTSQSTQPHLLHHPSTISDLGDLREDPLSHYSFQQPRSKSSQAENRDSTQMDAHDPFSGSVSAPVTGLFGTSHPEQGRISLEPTPALLSLPSSSSGSLIERPPLSPVLPPPTNVMTNAAMSGNQPGCFPTAHSYPHLPTNATNATGDAFNTSQTSSSSYPTNAVGYPTTPPQASAEAISNLPGVKESSTLPLQSRDLTRNSQQKEEHVSEVSSTEKDYLTLNKGKLLEGDHSLSSSLNQSRSSLLESQEDITQVQILPPAPESHPLPPPKDPPSVPSHFSPPQSSTREHVGLVPGHVTPSTEESVVSDPKTPRQTMQDQMDTVYPSTRPQPEVHHGNPHSSVIPDNISPSNPVAAPPNIYNTHTIPQVTPAANPTHSTIPSNYAAHSVYGAPTLPPPPASSGLEMQGEEDVGSLLLQNRLPNSGPLPEAVGHTLQGTPSVVQVPTSDQAQQRTNAQLPVSSQSDNISHSSNMTSGDGSSGDAGSMLHQVQHQHHSQHVTTSVTLPAHLAVQSGLPPNGPIEGQVSTTEGTHQAQFTHSVCSQPLLPPPGPQPPQSHSTVPSNAQIVSQSPASVLSNAHPLSSQSSMPLLSNAQLPHSEHAGIQGVLSNAYLSSQYTPQSLVTGVQPIVSSDGIVQPPHSQTAAAPIVSAVAVPPTVTKPPPPQNVPLHQMPITHTLPSTPDSVFSSQATSEPPLATSNAVSGTVPGTHNVLISSSGVPNAPPRVHLTVTQTSMPPTPISAPQSSVQSDMPAPLAQIGSRQAQTGIQPASHPHHLHSNTNAAVDVTHTAGNNPQAIASSSMTNAAGSLSQHTTQSSVSVERAIAAKPAEQTLPSAQHSNPFSTAPSMQQHQPPVGTGQHSSSTGPIQSMTLRDSSTAHPRGHTGEQRKLPSTAYQERPLPSTSAPQRSHPHHHHHPHTTEHPPPTSRPPREYSSRSAVGENVRPWRHTAEIQHRERYDHYYADDPYHYERSGHYPPYEEDQYDYYREMPGGRVPPPMDRYSYYHDHYEHDPYAYDRLYHRQVKEYDPYTGHYYYVDDPYAYADPRGYDPYGHVYDDGYEHPIPHGAREERHAHRQQQTEPQKYTQEHAQEYLGPHEAVTETTASAYHEQSTIYGGHDVFEEGGTFVDSPNVHGGHVAPRHPQHPPYPDGTAHPEYHEYSHYDQEPPVQPRWDSAEGAPATSKPQETPLVLRRTPEMFAHPHVRASFAPGGTLVVVLPHNLRAFQRAEVELSHITELVGNTVNANFIQAVSEFPGPLMPGETPKSVAISYSSRQAEQCRVRKEGEEGEEEKEEGEDADAAKECQDEALLWDFLVLLCQHNGVVVASDISELLTREKTTVISARTHVGSGDQEEALENMRQLLIAGRKRDALELACSQCLWGHALMMASKMDEQSRTYVINRFTASLLTADPLSTFYTLMLGRTPSAVKPDGLRRAGSWRPHLAMILANRTNKLDNTSIVTLGDSLLESGRLCAAHFCYHLADMQFGSYGCAQSKYLLLGVLSSHLTMGAFPKPEYLRKMEIFEYAMSLGKQDFILPHFQVFKYLLALQLTQVGMVAKAFKYCEQIAVFISRSPGKFPPTLLHVVDQLSTQLHHLNHPHGVVETELPSWLLQLQQTTTDILAGNFIPSARSTPSPTFSSVSQAYRHNDYGQGRNRYLKVPGGNFKGSSIETSPATSSKEGSVEGQDVTVGVSPTEQAGQQELYQPTSNVQQQQQPATGHSLTQPPQQAGQFQSDVSYSQNTMAQISGEGGQVVSSSAPADEANSVVPYYAPAQDYGDSYPVATVGVATSEGNQLQPSSDQHLHPVQDSTAPGGYLEFGTSSTALPDEQQQILTEDHRLYAPAPPDGQQLQHQGVMGVESQSAQEQAQQFPYEPQPLQQTDYSMVQGHVYQPSIQPEAPPTTNEPSYGAAGYWDHPPPTSDSGSGDVYEGASPAITGQLGDDVEHKTNAREQEEKEEEKNKKGVFVRCMYCICSFVAALCCVKRLPRQIVSLAVPFCA